MRNLDNHIRNLNFHVGTGAVSVYNTDQKAMIENFGAKEKDAAYLFFVENVKNNCLSYNK